MSEFDTIHLVWRKGTGGRRFSVGVLQKAPDGRHIFKYTDNAGKYQREEGFTPYTEFQDLRKEYNGNIAEIFGQRLTKTDRPDSASFFNFWEVDPSKVKDKFYLLGKTQGLVATDNFEFLAEYHLAADTHFLTEVAGLSTIPLPTGTVKPGELLRFELEPTNEHDPLAVKIFRGDTLLGYIKKYHNKIFHEKGGDKLRLSVKAVEQNGLIKRIFVRVFINK